MDEALKRIPRERLANQMRLHKEANFTMIRNWVGQSTSEDFYDLCDRNGLMVWDEFFEAHRADGPLPNDLELYLANVREKVLAVSQPPLHRHLVRPQRSGARAAGAGGGHQADHE